MSEPAKSSATPPPKTANDQASVGEVVEFVKTYAKQETVGPLKNAASFLVFGVIGAVLIGFGLFMLLLGVLRVVQTEWSATQDSEAIASIVPYLIVLVIAIALVAYFLQQIKKTFLTKDDQ